MVLVVMLVNDYDDDKVDDDGDNDGRRNDEDGENDDAEDVDNDDQDNDDDDDDGDIDEGHDVEDDHMSLSESYKISGCGSSNPDLKVGTKMCESCAMQHMIWPQLFLLKHP